MRIFSTFTGIGGFEIAIQNAWRTHVQTLRGGQASTEGVDEKWQRLHTFSAETAIPTIRRNNEHIDARIDEGQPHCIGYSEIDKYAIKVYEKQFPGVKNYGDITKINAKELPDFDCLVGGFPCQAFSIAGKRRGFDDTRGTLFFDLARILREKQPRYFVFENVKGLLSHDQGNTFRTIIATIDELGYDCQWSVLNSKDFGVPQNRERIYIVGHLRGTPRPEVFPIGESNTEDFESTRNESVSEQEFYRSKQVEEVQINNTSMVGPRITQKGYSGTLDGSSGQGVRVYQDTTRGKLGQNGKGWKDNEMYTLDTLSKNKIGIQQLNNPTHSNDRVYGSDGISPTLNTMQGGNRQPKIVDFNRKDGIGKELEVAHTLSAGDYRGLNRNQSQTAVIEQARIRRLTPIECERLQGFPDQHTAFGKDGEVISDTQRYKMCGNAVSVPVVEAVFRRILNG